MGECLTNSKFVCLPYANKTDWLKATVEIVSKFIIVGVVVVVVIYNISIMFIFN